MLITEYVENKWNSKNKARYVSLGYHFTKMGDTLLVKAFDLPNGSNVRVKCKCDYCGVEYDVSWYHFINSRKILNNDCCINPECTGKKASDILMIKYGVPNAASIESANDKRKQTNLKKYGCENVFSNEQVKQKIYDTNYERYGCKIPTQNPEIIKKAQETSLERYGNIHYTKTREWRESHSGENSPCWKGGISRERYERATVEYRDWRNAIFQRDNYTCQICGIRGGVEINAHHIKNWRDNEADRYSIDNGICMCERCHLKFHSLYGKRNNNKEQLQEFIELFRKDMLNL